MVLYVFLGFVVSLIFLFGYRNWATQVQLWDQPNRRSSHDLPVIRGAGLLFPLILPLLAGSVTWLGFDLALRQGATLILSASVVAWVGWRDDRSQVRVRTRFMVHFMMAVFAVWGLGGLGSISLGAWVWHWGAPGSVLGVIAVLWSINLFNFMDGVDGIAGVEALTVLGAGGLLFYLHQAPWLAWICWGLCASMLAFLIFNWAPAKLFMGDVGSGFLGFLIAALAIIGQTHYEISVFHWIILYAVFWLDATGTLLRRLLRGDTLHHAHRSHAYQRLQLVGWSHQRISLAVLVLNLMLVILSLLGYFYPTGMGWMLGLGLLLPLLAYVLLERFAPM